MDRDIVSDFVRIRFEDDEKTKLLWTKNAELKLASQKSALLAPTAVQEKIDDLVKWSQEMVTSSTHPKNFSGVWVQMVVQHQHLTNRVARAASLDLGSPPALRQKWWNWWRDRRDP
jgi:hypothetical protein